MTDDLTVSFALLGSKSVKVARKHIDEIDPWSLSKYLILKFHHIWYSWLQEAFIFREQIERGEKN